MIKLIGVFLLVVSVCNASALPTCACTREYRPVCGSDGKTYGNPCLFNCARETMKDLTMARPGTCEEDPATCLCTYEYQPVCGSDGTTYPNLCSLNCQRHANPILEPRYDGTCKSEKIEELPTCFCTRERKPVCGNDGITYSNPCVFKCHARTKTDLAMKNIGPCEEVIRVAELPLPIPQLCACPMHMQPVCGTDGVTYNNICSLNCASQNRPVGLQSEGPCDDVISVTLMPMLANRNCACGRHYIPVCGSDGKTYSNTCTLNCAKAKNAKLKVSHVGPCDSPDY